jgi:hypothetical protein
MAAQRQFCDDSAKTKTEEGNINETRERRDYRATTTTKLGET